MRTRRTFLPCWKDAGRTTAGEKERRDMLSVVTDEAAPCELGMSLDELAREGTRRMLAAALEAEVDADIACLAELTDEHGHRLVVRNGRAPDRQVATGAGQVEVIRPRVDVRRVDRRLGNSTSSRA